MTPAFPATLPGVSSLDWVADGNLSITEAEIGPKDYRQRSRVPSAKASVTWRFLADDFATFQDFWVNDLKRGHKWFTLVLPCGAGYAVHVVKFVSHRSAQSDGYGYRTVQAELYVRERKLRPDTVDTFITSTPYPILATEAFDVAFTVLSGSLGDRVAYADDLLDVALTVLGGSLPVALKGYPGFQEDRLDAVFTVLSGTLTDVLKTYAGFQEDRLAASFTVLSGSLEEALIRYDNYGNEALDIGFTVLSGTLA